ncbi:MAG: hypothetical protein AB7O38_25010, partial [Pirellulaceae bacterium]
MRLAFYGTDALFPALARKLAEGPDELVAAAQAGSLVDAIRASFPAVRVESQWDGLLAQGTLDAVIYAPPPAESMDDEPLRRLAQTGIPLLVLHPACDVMLAYEIELIRRDAGAIVVPGAPEWSHPAWQWLREWALSPNEPGSSVAVPVRQIRWTRYLRDRSRSAILRQFGRDEVLIRQFLGPLASVNAVDDDTEAHSLAVFNISSTAAAGGTCHWTLASDDEPVSRVVIARGDVLATLRIPHSGASELSWSIHVEGPDVQDTHFDVQDDVTRIVDQLRRAVVSSALAPMGPAITWNDACVSLETADGVERSLRRKRAIDLHVADRSEESVFKGYMAAGGCL